MILLTLDPSVGRMIVEHVKHLSDVHPGPLRITLRVGATDVELGPAWRYEPSPACMAALAEWGDVRITEPTTRR